EVALLEQTEVNYRLFLSKLPEHGRDQGNDDRDAHPGNPAGGEPVFPLAFVEDDLQEPKTHGDEAQTDVVDLDPSGMLAGQIGRIGDEHQGQHQGHQTYRHVDEKNPPPTVV